MRLYWYLRSVFKAWNYRRKFGIDIAEGISEYGRFVKLNTTIEPTDTDETDIENYQDLPNQ